MVDNDHRAMQAAFAAVQEHVLPGLDDAAEEAGPRILLAMQFKLAEAWVELGYPAEALLEAIAAVSAKRAAPTWH